MRGKKEKNYYGQQSSKYRSKDSEYHYGVADACAGGDFSGMSLRQFQDAVKPSFDARESISTKEDEMTALINQRNDADEASLQKCSQVVSAVKGDPNFGEDSDLYETMGYVRKSERKSGLTRKGGAAPAPPA